MAQTTMNINRRRNFQRTYVKPQWEIDAENAERERQAEIARNLEDTEENFPSLVTTKKDKPAWGGARKFSELANEWNSRDEQKKAEEEEKKKGKPAADDSFGFVLPKFTPSQRFVEAEDDGMTPAPAPVPTDVLGSEVDDSGDWTTVDHRAKRQARLFRKNARKEAELRRRDELGDAADDEEDANEEEEENTCWNDAAPQAHETCWDENRHP